MSSVYSDPRHGSRPRDKDQKVKSFAFTPDQGAKGSGYGIYAGSGKTTRNLPASTLFVNCVPHRTSLSEVESLFKRAPGFVAFRT